MDRNEVIKALEECQKSTCSKDCPCYDNGIELAVDCERALMRDALALLKEQEEQVQIAHEEGFHEGYMQAMREAQPTIEAESVKPVKSKLSWERGYNWDIWDCGHCGRQLRDDANYCDRCGHKVNWDDMEESDA